MSHLYATRNPMSEARRNVVHGPLEPLEYDARRDVIGLLIAIPVLVGAVVLFLVCVGAWK